MEKFYTTIGDFLLSFGKLETYTVYANLWIIGELYQPTKSHEFLISVLEKSNFESNLMSLENLIKGLPIHCKNDWKECQSNIRELQRKRNVYAHQMFGLEEGNLIKRTKKGWQTFNIEDIEKNLKLLHELNRQLHDSIFFALEELTDKLYLSKFSRLKIE